MPRGSVPWIIGLVGLAAILAAIVARPDPQGTALLLAAIALGVVALLMQELRVRGASAASDDANRRMVTLATTDELTRLQNRTAFERSVEGEIARARRTTGHFALVAIRIRGLSGPADGALQTFAACLREQTRAVDSRARLGGDAFAVVLVGADAATTRTILSRIRTGCGDVASGVAYYPTDGDGSAQLIRFAEERASV